MTSCARCGAELRSENAGGFCVRCLLESGLKDSSPTSGEGAIKSARIPSVRCFGEYELLEEVARGGMGVVYRARQNSLNRIVALKIMLSGQFASKQMIQRFRGEVTAAALLQHPNIVAIHEVGIHEDQHYFSMDYVQGQNLSQLVGTRPLAPGHAARYVKIIAEAIHYAHEQGILHRDLKPSNVLIDSVTDQPRLTDFGLAKRLDGESSLTVSGQVLGSPNFMPPEQAGIGHGKVGRQSDVYGVGAILYYLLLGRPPFQADSLQDVLKQVSEHEPVAPRALNPGVPRDLETICLKCLAKEPGRRYATARELAEEVEDFLQHKPIRARPISGTERAWRWCRRKPAIATLGGAITILLFLIAVGSPIAILLIAKERDRAKHEANRADQNLYDSDMSLAQHAWDEGDFGKAQNLLEAHRRRADEPDRRQFEWFYLRELSQGDQSMVFTNYGPVTCVAFSPDGKSLAIGSVGHPVELRETATGKTVKTFPEKNVTSLAFTPGGELLGIGGQDRLTIWNVETEQIVFKHDESVARFYIAFVDGGTLFVMGKHAGLRRFGKDGGSTQLWDYAAHELKYVFPESGGYIAVSLRGNLLATANFNQTTKIWNLETRQLIADLSTKGVVTMAFSPDGQVLAVRPAGTTVVDLWQIASGRKIGSLDTPHEKVWTLAFSPDGQFLATAGANQLIHIWNLAKFRQVEELHGHRSEIMSLAFSVDGNTLASGCKDNTAMVWRIHPHRERSSVSNLTSHPIFSEDGRSVAAGIDGAVAVWDVNTLEVRSILAGAGEAVAFRDNNTLVTHSTNDFLQAFDLSSKRSRELVSRGPVAELPSTATLSPDGRTLASGSVDGTITFFDAKTGTISARAEHIFAGDVFKVVFSRNGKLLAAAGREVEAGRIPAAKVFDAKNLQVIAALVGHTDTVLGLEFSPDSRILATCGGDDSIKFWDTATWDEVPPALRQKEAVSCVAFSPNGRTLASSCFDDTIKLWDFVTRHEVTSLRAGAARYITFSPDGQTLAVEGWDRVLRLWRAPIK
jgi:WD40 repeat protein